jgi:hypothetical protein
MNPTEKQLALQLFDQWFAANYPGPNTIINDPHWHAPTIFRAVLSCVREVEQGTKVAEPHAEPSTAA